MVNLNIPSSQACEDFMAGLSALGLFVTHLDCEVWIDGENEADGVAFASSFDFVESARARKIAELSADCQADIEAGFASSAIGEEIFYDGGIEDQLNLVGAALAQTDLQFRARAVGESTKSFKFHTAAQMAQVFADGVNYKLACLTKLETLRAAVAAAETVADVNAVSW